MVDETDVDFLEDNDQKGKFMTFKIGNECFGISIEYIDEIAVMQPITIIPESISYVKGMINLRGKVIPVIDVRARFKMESVEYTDRACIIVINVDSAKIGLIVEQIAEVDTIKDEDIIPPPVIGQTRYIQNKYVYGMAGTEDFVKLLLNPKELVGIDVIQELHIRDER